MGILRREPIHNIDNRLPGSSNHSVLFGQPSLERDATILYEPDLNDRVVRENLDYTLSAFAQIAGVERVVIICPPESKGRFDGLFSRFSRLFFFPWEQQNNYALLRAALVYPSGLYFRMRGAWEPETVKRFVAPAIERFRQDRGLLGRYRPELIPLAGIVSHSFLEMFDRRVLSLLKKARFKISPDGLLGDAIQQPLGLVPRNYAIGTVDEALHFFVDFSELYCPYPNVVWISPTNLCNFRCENCFIYQHKTATQRAFFRKKIIMDFDSWCHVIDEITAWTTDFDIKLGSIEEPLMHLIFPHYLFFFCV
jgi:hypothetical protein